MKTQLEYNGNRKLSAERSNYLTEISQIKGIMRFCWGGEKVRLQIKVNSHSNCSEILTGTANIRCEVCFVKKTPQLNGVNVLKPLVGWMWQAKDTGKKTVNENKTVDAAGEEVFGYCLIDYCRGYFSCHSDKKKLQLQTRVILIHGIVCPSKYWFMRLLSPLVKTNRSKLVLDELRYSQN